jgi:putative transposase
MIYTTNAIESLNSTLRRSVRSRGHFPSDDAAVKLIWLQLREITKDWKMPAREWHAAKAQFALVFGDRFEMNHKLIRPVSHRNPETPLVTPAVSRFP